MSKRSKISAFFGSIGSAVSVASAIEGNRMPNSADLRALGIDPAEFRKIVSR